MTVVRNPIHESLSNHECNRDAPYLNKVMVRVTDGFRVRVRVRVRVTVRVRVRVTVR